MEYLVRERREWEEIFFRPLHMYSLEGCWVFMSHMSRGHIRSCSLPVADVTCSLGAVRRSRLCTTISSTGKQIQWGYCNIYHCRNCCNVCMSRVSQGRALFRWWEKKNGNEPGSGANYESSKLVFISHGYLRHVDADWHANFAFAFSCTPYLRMWSWWRQFLCWLDWDVHFCGTHWRGYSRGARCSCSSTEYFWKPGTIRSAIIGDDQLTICALLLTELTYLLQTYYYSSPYQYYMPLCNMLTMVIHFIHSQRLPKNTSALIWSTLQFLAAKEKIVQKANASC